MRAGRSTTAFWMQNLGRSLAIGQGLTASHSPQHRVYSRSCREGRAGVAVAGFCAAVMLAVFPAHAAPQSADDDDTEKSAEAPAPDGDATDDEAPKVYKRVKVMVPDVKSVSDGLLAVDIETTSALLSYQLGQVPAFDVVSSRDIREMLAMETNKQLAGCTGEASCLSEIAGALDADLVVTALMSQLGGRKVLQVSIIDTQEASVKGRKRVEVKRMTDLAEVLRKELDSLVEPWGGMPSSGDDDNVSPNTSFGRSIASLANRPDTSMLLVQVLVGGLGVILPLMLVTPVAQALTFFLLGEEIAGRDYPNWWWAIFAGYSAYVVSFIVAIIVGVVVGQFLPAYAVGSAVATFFAGAFVFEPLIAWGGGIVGARDSEIAAFENANPNGAPDTEVVPPPPPSESVGFMIPTPMEIFGVAKQQTPLRKILPLHLTR